MTDFEASPPDPTPHVEPAPPAGRGSGACCLRGCLGCSFVLVLLGVAVVFGWLHFGWPWLEAQKERLVERFPLARAIPTLGYTLPAGGITLEAGEAGSPDRAHFPADVWLPDDPLDGVFNTTPRLALAILTLPPVDPVRVAAQARSEMAVRGWRRTPVPDPHDGTALLFERDGRRTSMQIFAVEAGTELWVRCSGPEKPPLSR